MASMPDGSETADLDAVEGPMPWKQTLDAAYAAAAEDKIPEDKTSEELFQELDPREKLERCLRAEMMALDHALLEELKLREDLQLRLGRAQRLGREMLEMLDTMAQQVSSHADGEDGKSISDI